MKLVIASDIHGSAYWCRRLMAQIEAHSPDRVVLLGDLLYHGPRNPLPDMYDPAQVAEMLNGIAQDVLAVRGNCDSEVDQMVLNFPCLADYALVFDGERQLFCTHGHLAGLSPEDLPALPEGSLFVHGHFHVKRDELVTNAQGNQLRLLNPGSVSLPKDATCSYVVYEDGKVTFYELCSDRADERESL